MHRLRRYKTVQLNTVSIIKEIESRLGKYEQKCSIMCEVIIRKLIKLKFSLIVATVANVKLKSCLNYNRTLKI